MAIEETREIARVDVNDDYGVTLYQRRRLLELTAEEAIVYAGEIVAKAQEAQRYADELQTELVAEVNERESANWRNVGVELPGEEPAL